MKSKHWRREKKNLPKAKRIWKYKLQDHDHDLTIKKLEEGLKHNHHAYNDD
jgi:hypothetical protein